MTIIDLSQEIFPGMPVFKGMPEVNITIHSTHEEWNGITVSPEDEVSPSVHRLEFSEHTGTHVDALNHMRREDRGLSIDTMPLSMFYTPAVCLDLSNKTAPQLIETEDLMKASHAAGVSIGAGDTVLIFTDHYRRAFGTNDWPHGPGLSEAAARWLGKQKIAAFGVETMAPGVSGISNRQVHQVCGEMRFTHYENLVNLHMLIGKGRFRFIGLPLKIRGGTGSPVRAVAVLNEEPI